MGKTMTKGGWLLLLAVLAGCTTMSAPQTREFVMESAWVRPTTKSEFLGFRRMNRMSPLINDTLVIQANAIDGIMAFDRKSGAQVWRLDVENGVEGGAQVAAGRLYFGGSDGQFYAVDPATGKVFWKIPVRAETLAPPTVEGGVVYFQSGADVLYALDAETGKQLWLYNRQVTTNLSIRATTRPVVAGETVLAGFSDGYIVAVRKRDGGLLWERKLGKGNRFRDVDTTPVIDGQTAYVASFDAALYALNVETGEVIWSIEEGGYVPVTLGRETRADRLYYATAGGKLMTLDKASGKQLQVIQVAKGIATQPTLYKNFLVYGESQGSLVVADPETLQPIGTFAPGHGLVSRPVIADTGDAYFISNGANLFAVRMAYENTAARLPWQRKK